MVNARLQLRRCSRMLADLGVPAQFRTIDLGRRLEVRSGRPPGSG